MRLNAAFFRDLLGNRSFRVFPLAPVPLFSSLGYAAEVEDRFSLISTENEHVVFHFEMNAVAFLYVKLVSERLGNCDLTFFRYSGHFLPPK